MAISGSWGFTNTTASLHDLIPVVIDTASKYAVTTDTVGKTVIRNVTSPQDQEEVITYQGQDIKKVVQTLKNSNPPRNEAGRTINVKLEAKKRLTSSTDDTFVVDLPVSIDLTFRFTKSQYLTSSDLELLLTRMIGALRDSDDSGNTRLDNLMLGQYNPNN
jgi:hypothetical protein